MKNLSITLVIAFLAFVYTQSFAQKPTVKTDAGNIEVNTVAENLNHPWAIAFLPDGRLLVTERNAGTLRILNNNNNELSDPLRGTPEVFSVGQGGMLDVALDPEYANNKYIYLSYAEPGENNTATTALGRGKLQGNSIKDFKVIFRMEPFVEGKNHFGGRIIFSNDGQIFLTLAERFQFDPAQDLTNHLGTVVRINPDGSVPKGNPFIENKVAKDEIWSYGHRNIEAGAIDPSTRKLWIVEMGPMGGDELNLVERGANYGWPLVSWGDNYDGTKIPRPNTRKEFEDAKIHWTPTISPSGMIFYLGDMYPAWKGTALIGGLTSTGLVRVSINNSEAEEVERIPLGVRIRDVEQAPDGSVYVITDEDNGKILQLKKMK